MGHEYETVIGLEVHVELHTKSKIFCACPNEFGAEPNTHVCPICAGFPGMLPVLNKEAVELSIKAGLALNCHIAEVCKFDRKNYFYPDLPKAYQISQFAMPICQQGYLEIDVDGAPKRIGIHRAHMEEDAGKLIHQGAITETLYTLVDLNRSGVPLLEIVSEPDMRSAEEARDYLEKLRAVLLFAGVSDCKMEEGSLRCDANVSIRPLGEKKLGTRTEIKNLNSFRSLERAIEYEVNRQKERLEDGGTIIQETLTWDEEKQVTRSLRSKEEAHDYRYFPDPDLVPIHISRDWVEALRRNLPEMPDQARERLMKEQGLPAYDAAIISLSPDYLAFFDACAARYSNAKVVSNWMMVELNRLLNLHNMNISECKINSNDFILMLNYIDNGTISGKMAKNVFEEMFATGSSPDKIIQEKGMVQISDEKALLQLVRKVLEENPEVVRDYKNGKEKALGFLVGQIMKVTKGQANPGLVNKILKETLTEE